MDYEERALIELSVKAQILELKVQIDDHRQALHDKVERIREDAKHYERDAVDRAYSEIEPMRRQMEAMIKSLAEYEGLQAPAPVLIPTN